MSRGGNEWNGLSGCLDQRLTFRDVVSTNVADEGEPDQVYANTCTVWGNQRDLKGKELFEFEQETAEAMAVFTVRYQSASPKANSLIVWNGVEYEVAAPPLVLGNFDAWMIYAKKRRAN